MKNFLTGFLVAGALLLSMNVVLACDNNCSCNENKKCTCYEQKCNKDCDCGCQNGGKCTCKKECNCKKNDCNKNDCNCQQKCDKDCDCGCQDDKKYTCKKESRIKTFFKKHFSRNKN